MMNEQSISNKIKECIEKKQVGLFCILNDGFKVISNIPYSDNLGNEKNAFDKKPFINK